VSPSNAQLAREVVESLIERDRDSWLASFDPEVEYTPVKEWPESSTLQGTDALWRFMESVRDEWAEWDMRVRDLHENGDRVLVEATVRGVGEKRGAELRGRLFFVYTFRGGRIVRVQDFLARSEAYAAAGLEPPT
jgi:ketosteroid isomerase-like protein